MGEIYRAEYLSPVDMTQRQLQPFVRLKYGGIHKDTLDCDTAKSSNPEFN